MPLILSSSSGSIWVPDGNVLVLIGSATGQSLNVTVSQVAATDIGSAVLISPSLVTYSINMT